MIEKFRNTVINADVVDGLKQLPEESIDCVVTSPPYWGLRQYLPDKVKLKDNCPDFVLEELEKLGISSSILY